MTPNDWPTMTCGCPALSGWCEHMTTEYRKRPIGEGPFARIRELQESVSFYKDAFNELQVVVNEQAEEKINLRKALDKALVAIDAILPGASLNDEGKQRIAVEAHEFAFRTLKKQTCNACGFPMKGNVCSAINCPDCPGADVVAEEREFHAFRKYSGNECDGLNLCGHCPVCSE